MGRKDEYPYRNKDIARHLARLYIMAALSRGAPAVAIPRSFGASFEVSVTGDDVCGLQTSAYSVLGGMGGFDPPTVSADDKDFADESVSGVIRSRLETTR